MNREEIFNKVKEIIVDVTEIDSGEIKEESSMMDDLSLSSMEVMTVIAEVEETFSLKIPEKDLRNFVTVSDLVDYVSKRKSE